MVIFDTSTLILLAKAEFLWDILEKMEAAIPDIVRREATVRKERVDALLIQQCIEEGLIQVQEEKKLKKAHLTRLMQDFRLAEGEAAALFLAQQKNSCLATDDGPAIKACKILGVPFVTAINLLVHAFQKGWIAKEIALVKLETLNQVGRYDIRIVQDARERIDHSMRG